jgi:hypothetical protein
MTDELERSCCEDCGEIPEREARRIRCPRCNKLVCRWCYHHVHAAELKVFTEAK